MIIKLEESLYYKKAQTLRVIDGDTAVFMADLGHKIHHKIHLRFLGFNAPEIRGKGKAVGFIVRDFLVNLIDGEEVIIKTIKADSFGRWLGYVWIRGENVNDAVVAFMKRNGIKQKH